MKKTSLFDKVLIIVEVIARYFGRFSFVLALLAYLPSIAPFTPALLGSVLAFFGAIVGALSGEKRLAVLTIYIVIATFLVSPVFKGIEHYISLGFLVVGLIILGIVLAIGLHNNFNASKYKIE